MNDDTPRVHTDAVQESTKRFARIDAGSRFVMATIALFGLFVVLALTLSPWFWIGALLFGAYAVGMLIRAGIRLRHPAELTRQGGAEESADRD